jgi:hypothetical protein
MVEAINSDPSPREALEKIQGKVWDTQQLSQDFDVLGFMAPFVIVRQKSTGKKGTLYFQHNPRFYFGWSEDEG